MYSKIINTEEDDELILGKYLESLNDEQLTVLYYKNNLLQFIGEHDIIKDLIIQIFDSVENLDYYDKDDDEWYQKIPSKYQAGL